MTKNTMTYTVAIDNALAGNLTDEVKERLEALKISLSKRNKKTGKPTKTQVANEGLRAEILTFIKMNGGKAWNSEIAEHFGITSSKVSPQTARLIADGFLEKSEEKREGAKSKSTVYTLKEVVENEDEGE